MTAATSWLDLFDFKFEKYLTPWIVRVTWAVALVVSALWLTIALFSVVLTLISSDADSSLSEQSLSSERDFRLPELESARTIPPSSAPMSKPRTAPLRPQWEFRPPKLPPQFLIATAAAITTVTAMLVCLLWVRVFLETMIVVFNIATTLKDIDRKLTPGGPGASA